MKSLTDHTDWVRAAKAGEEPAWNILYKQYYPAIYATALRLCGNTDVAKDAVQDTFMTAYIKLEQLKDIAAFGGWLKKIVIHNCYKVKNDLPVKVPLDKISLETDAWWENELSRKFEVLSMQNRLHGLLAQLPEALRSTVLLRYFSHFQSYEEIARILSTPVGTIRSRLNQAKTKLSALWKQQSEADIKIFKKSEELNGFYYTSFSAMHREDNWKNRFINHLQKDVQIISPDGRPNTGRRLFEKMIVDDRKYGSWLTPSNVVTSGNISLVEARHYNSSEYPDHCPPTSILVIYRDQNEVSKLSFHPALQ